MAARKRIGALLKLPPHYSGNYSGESNKSQHQDILYNNGSEELYDHENDPYEWANLANDSRYGELKADLKDRLSRMTGR